MKYFIGLIFTLGVCSVQAALSGAFICTFELREYLNEGDQTVNYISNLKPTCEELTAFKNAEDSCSVFEDGYHRCHFIGCIQDPFNDCSPYF